MYYTDIVHMHYYPLAHHMYVLPVLFTPIDFIIPHTFSHYWFLLESFHFPIFDFLLHQFFLTLKAKFICSPPTM